MLKRLFDFSAALILIILLLPLFIILAVLIRINLGSPVLFKQKRPGLESKPFNLYKFRTMNDNIDTAGNIMPDEERLTKFGKLLRKFSLDELPQLLNVLMGELSFVGPRPLLMQYLERYNKKQARRHEVKPGLTGWAQVNGRNLVSWEDKFNYDVWYVENRSFALDMKILLLTVLKVLKAEGISQKGYETVPEFMGNGKNEKDFSGSD